MPIKTDSLNRKLYDLLDTRGYNPIPKDSDVTNAGKTVAPEEADVFRFTFTKGGEKVDDAWITVDGSQNLVVYYDQDIAKNANEKTPGSQFDDSWYGLLKHLKKWAHTRQLSFKLEPKEKLDSDMAQRTYMKKKEQIAEGYYPMGKQASYSDAIPTVKIVLQHTRQIQEGEQRYRNVARIFLENTHGERILAPTTKPGIAQIYARHLAEGGVPNDDRWNHIKSLCEEYSKMAGFVRAVRGNQFNESAQRLVEAGLNHYQNLRESLGKMRGHRGYNAYFESWTPTLMETEGDESNLNELFVQETLDPRIESVMPILSKLKLNLGEMKEVNELAEWADNVTEQENRAALNPVGIPESEEVEEGVVSELSKKTLGKYVKAAAKDAEAAGRDQEYHGHKNDYARGEKRQKGIEKAVDRLTKEGVEEVEESGLQAYLGNKKYGKEGMNALRKAGQEGASKEKMANIRAKYDKLDEEDVVEGEIEDAEAAHKKINTPAAFRKAKGGDWKVSSQDLEKEKSRTPTSPEGLAALKKKMGEIEESVSEDLDANQKRVGQLGPTEKVKNNNIGKLVGANESVEYDPLDELKKLLGK